MFTCILYIALADQATSFSFRYEIPCALIRMGCIVSQSLDINVKETIDQNIASKPVFMVSKSWCPYCRKAKQVLARYSVPAQNITIMEIDGDTSYWS